MNKRMNEWLVREGSCLVLSQRAKRQPTDVGREEMPWADRFQLTLRKKAGMAGRLPRRAAGGLPLEIPSPWLAWALLWWAEYRMRQIRRPSDRGELVWWCRWVWTCMREGGRERPKSRVGAYPPRPQAFRLAPSHQTDEWPWLR